MHTRSPWILPTIALLACSPADQEAPPPPPPVDVAEDIAAAAPTHVRTLFENDFVRLLEVTLQPQEGLPVHRGGDRVVYSLGDYRLRFVEESTDEEARWEEGDVHWHDADEHSVANVGTETARFLVVERRASAVGGGVVAPDPGDAAAMDPDHGELLLDSEDARVVRVTLAPGEAQPLHQGLPRLVYSLTPYTIRYTEAGQDPVERSFQAGDAHWHEAGEHAVENTGATEARYVVIQFRR